MRQPFYQRLHKVEQELMCKGLKCHFLQHKCNDGHVMLQATAYMTRPLNVLKWLLLFEQHLLNWEQQLHTGSSQDSCLYNCQGSCHTLEVIHKAKSMLKVLRSEHRHA